MTSMDVKIETQDVLKEEQMERDGEEDKLEGDEEVGENLECDGEEGENFEGDGEEGENFEGDGEEGENFEGDGKEGENFEGDGEEGENFEGDGEEAENFEGYEEEEDEDDEILLEKYVFLYTIPNLTTSKDDQSENKDGDSSKKDKQKGSNQRFKASEWDIANPAKTCKLVLFAAGPFCHIQLEYIDPQEQPVFGQSVIEKDFSSVLQPTKDSSRYFAFKFQNIKGEYETMGLGFINRSDSADVLKILKLYFESENKEAVTNEARRLMALSKQTEMGENEASASMKVESTALTSTENPASVKSVSTPGKETQATTSTKTAINNTDTTHKNTNNNSKKPNSQSQQVQNSEPASKRLKPNAQNPSTQKQNVIKTGPSRENEKMKPKTNTSNNNKNLVSKTRYHKGSIHQKIPDLRAIKVSPPKSRAVRQQPSRNHPRISPSPWAQHLPNVAIPIPIPNPILIAPPPPIISILAVPPARFPDRGRDRNRSSSLKSSPNHSRRTSKDTNARNNGVQRRYDRDTVGSGSGSGSRDHHTIPQCRICVRIGRTRQLRHGPADCPLNKSKQRKIPDLFSIKVNPNAKNPNLNNNKIRECLFCLHKGQLSGRDLCHSYLDCPTLREGSVQGSIWEFPPTPTVSNPVVALYDPVPSMPQVHFRPTFSNDHRNNDGYNGNLNFGDNNGGSAGDPVFWQHPDPRDFESPRPLSGSNYYGPKNNGPSPFFDPNQYSHDPEPGRYAETFGGPGPGPAIFTLNDRPGLLGPAPRQDPEPEFYLHPSGGVPNEYLNGNRNSIPSLFDIPAVPEPIWQGNEGYNNSNIHLDDAEVSWEIPECPHCLRSGKTYNLHHYREDCPSQVRRSVMS